MDLSGYVSCRLEELFMLWPSGSRNSALRGWDHQVGLMEWRHWCLPTATVFPLFAWLKNARGWGDWSWQPWGDWSCLRCVLFFFHPPSCAAVIASSLLLPAAIEWDRERKGKSASAREKGKRKAGGVNTSTQHLLPGEEKGVRRRQRRDRWLESTKAWECVNVGVRIVKNKD